MRCSLYTFLPSCGATCGKSLPCGRHCCPSVCHPGELTCDFIVMSSVLCVVGECGKCMVKEELVCHCGRSSKQETCGDLLPLKRSEGYSCGAKCNK